MKNKPDHRSLPLLGTRDITRRDFARGAAAAGIAFSLGGVLGGCQQSESSQGDNLSGTGESQLDSIVIYVGTEPEDGFDPITGWGQHGYMLFQQALLGFNSDITLRHELATDYGVSEDGLTYVFTIRDDIKFSDGTQLTAEDVAFTYLTAKESGSGVDLTKLRDAVAKDPITVEFTLEEPFSPFETLAAQLGIVPKAAYNSATYRENPIGSGPYKLVQWNKGQQVILEANEYFGGDEPFFKRVTILFLDETTAVANAQSGQLDVVMVSPDNARQAVAGMVLQTFDTVDNRCISFPLRPVHASDDGLVHGNDVTSDRAIRHALAIGLEREELIANALNGIGTPAYTRVDQLPWQNPDTIYTDNRVDEAIAELEEAGWLPGSDGIREKDDVRASFRLVVAASDPQRYDLGVAISQMAKERLGIEIMVESKTWDEIYDLGYSTSVLWGFGDYNPYDLNTGYHTDGEYNYSEYSDPQVDAYIDAAIAATDNETAIENWKKCQWDGTVGPESDKGELPYIWFVNIDHCYLTRENLSLGEQPIHPHGHGWPVAGNLHEWKWTD